MDVLDGYFDWRNNMDSKCVAGFLKRIRREILSLVQDTSSFEALCQSNHVFHDLDRPLCRFRPYVGNVMYNELVDA